MANARKINNPSADFFPGENDDPRFNRRVDPNAFPSQSDAANANERGEMWVEPDHDRISKEDRDDVWARYSDAAAADPRLDNEAQDAAWSKYEKDASSGAMFDAKTATTEHRSKKGLWLGGAAVALVIAGVAMAVTSNNNSAPREPASATEQALNSGAAGAAGAASLDPMNAEMQRNLANSQAAQTGITGGAGAATAPVEETASTGSATAATPPAAKAPAAVPANPVAKAVKAAPAKSPIAKSAAAVDPTTDDNLDAALPPTYWQGAPNPAPTAPAPVATDPAVIGSAPATPLLGAPEATPQPPATSEPVQPGALNLTPATPPAAEIAPAPEPVPQ
ncbi:MAG: hypothetical protein ABWZ40_01795 [Caulobacterales bacterium]